jgi:hypothetical protein
VNRKVTTPEGGSPADTRSGCHKRPIPNSERRPRRSSRQGERVTRSDR